MASSPPAKPGIRPGLRWSVWVLFLVAWTTALLTPQPVYLADALLPEESRFTAAKTLHVAAYAVLTILSGALPMSFRSRLGMALFLSAHAFGTEYLQGFVPPRVPSWFDVGYDHLGIGIGLGLSWKWWRPVRPTEDLRDTSNDSPAFDISRPNR